MNTRALSIKTTFNLVILFILSFVSLAKADDDNQECQWLQVDQNSFPEILTMIGEQVRENYNKIETWQGKAKIVTDIIDKGPRAEKKFKERIKNDGETIPNKIQEHQEFTREFSLDVNKGLLYEHYYQNGNNYIIDDDTGRTLQLRENWRLGSGKLILTPDYHIDCMEKTNRDGIIVGRTVIKQPRPKGEITCKSLLAPVYDPRESIRVFGSHLWETFDRIIAYIDKKGKLSVDSYTMKIEECNVRGIKKYKIFLPGRASTEPDVYIFSTLICSSEAGLNVVSYTNTDSTDRLLESKTWHYNSINNVYIPVRKTESLVDYRTGNLKEYSTITFIDQNINQKINEDIFTYKNLGLENNDEFIDKITGKEYRYEDANLVFVKNLPAAPEPNDSP